MAQGYKSMTVTQRLWIRSPLEGINYYLLINIFIYSLWHQGKSPALFPPLNTQCLEIYGGQFWTESPKFLLNNLTLFIRSKLCMLSCETQHRSFFYYGEVPQMTPENRIQTSILMRRCVVELRRSSFFNIIYIIL